MSAIGPKLTSPSAAHMSAFGGKADMTVCRSPLSWSLSGVKQTSLVAVHMSANDPKRTSASALHMSAFGGKADMRPPSQLFATGLGALGLLGWRRKRKP
jgi:hypothetical protein